MKKELIHFIRWELVEEKDVERVLSQLPEWGVENIVAHPKWFRRDGESYLKKIQNLLEKYHLRSTACHALWGSGNDCINPDPAIQKEMILRQSIFMKELQMLNVKTFTMHLGYHGEISFEENFSLLRETLDSLLPVCEETGIILALENGRESFEAFRKIEQIVKNYRHPNLGTCFDCGHANSYGGGVRNLLEVMKNNIVTCHLHDNYGVHDDHNPPGQGNINWQELNELLDTLPRLCHAETESGVWDKSAWNAFCAVLGKPLKTPQELFGRKTDDGQNC